MTISEYLYSGKSHTLSGISGDAIFAAADKTKVFVLDNSSDTVHALVLSEPGEIDTASASDVSLDITAAANDPIDLFFGPADEGGFGDPSGPMLVYDRGSGGVVEFTLPTAFSLTSGSASGNTLVDQSGFGVGLAVGNDGATLLVLAGTDGGLEEYDLITAYDITSATFDTTHSLSGMTSSAKTPRWMPGGLEIVAVRQEQIISGWPLSSAYDLSTAGAASDLDISGQVTAAKGIDITDDGARLFVSDGTTIYQYDAPSGPAAAQALEARYADIDAKDPKVTALVSPRDVQRSQDTHVHNLIEFPGEWVVPTIVRVGQLEEYRPGKHLFVQVDAAALKDGKDLRSVQMDADSPFPDEPQRITYRGKP